jgi:hypothetical protein
LSIRSPVTGSRCVVARPLTGPGIEEVHADTFVGERGRRREPREAAADHEDVGLGRVSLRVGLVGQDKI